MRSPSILLCVVCFLAQISAAAEDGWAPQLAGTDVALWGITYGADKFVAVGEGGAILYSTKGVIWTRATSPTTRGLFAVARGVGSFAAVGEGGVVLTSSDGITWHEVLVSNPFSSRLNGIAWTGLSQSGFDMYRGAGEEGRIVDGQGGSLNWSGNRLPGATGWIRGVAFRETNFYYAGRDGVGTAQPLRALAGANLEALVRGPESWVAVGQAGAIWVSADGQTWKQSTSPTTSHLNGVVCVDGSFFAVGSEGVVLIGQGRELVWRRDRVLSDSTATLRAVAASGSEVVAVGARGTILRRGATAVDVPTILMQPASVSAGVGSSVAFRVNATTDGGPISYQWRRRGEVMAGETSDLLALSAIETGDAGEYTVDVSSSGGRVTSAPAVLTVTPAKHPPVVDMSFRATGLATGGVVRVILPLADGRVVVAVDSRILRLLGDGRIDPTFTPATVAAEAPLLTLQPDGKIVAVGRLAGGVGRLALVRLHEDGRVDTGFVPPDEIVLSDGYGVGGSPTGAQVVAQPDGKLLVFVEPGRLWRLLPDGSLDPEFTPSRVGNGQSRGGSIALAADGKIYRAVPYDGVSRLLPNGQRDTTFVSRLASSSSFTLGSYAFQIAVTPAQQLVVNTITWASTSATSIAYTSDSARLLADGTVDPSFPTMSRWLLCPPAPDGTMLGTSGGGGNGVPSYITRVSDPRSIRLWSASGELLPALNWGFEPATNGQYVAAFASDGRLWLGGGFATFNRLPLPRLVRLNRVEQSALTERPYIASTASSPETILAGDATTLKVVAYSEGPTVYEWDPTGAGTDWSHSRVQRTVVPWLSHIPVALGNFRYLPDSVDGDTWAVRAINSAGASTVVRGKLRYKRVPLEVVAQPARVSATSGRSVRVWLDLPAGAAVRSLQWYKDGYPAPSPFSGTEWLPSGLVRYYLNIPEAAEAFAGNYTAIIVNYFGDRITTQPIVVTVAESSRFANLSVRAHVGAGEQAGVVGFVVPEGAPRYLLVRGIGPTLADFGVAGALPQAVLELFDSRGRSVFGPWRLVANADVFARLGAFPLTPGRGDASFATPQLSPGAYTVRLSDVNGRPGVGLVELYEIDNTSERLLNVSSRMYVGSGASAGIAGLAISGSVPKRVLIRGAGPALTAFGVEGALLDPKLDLRDSTGRLVAANNDWSTQLGAGVSPGVDLPALARGAGAFAFPAGSKDAALAITLSPGTYTVSLTGSAAEGGVGLLEVYELP